MYTCRSFVLNTVVVFDDNDIERIQTATIKSCYRKENRAMHFGITEKPTWDCLPL